MSTAGAAGPDEWVFARVKDDVAPLRGLDRPDPDVGGLLALAPVAVQAWRQARPQITAEDAEGQDLAAKLDRGQQAGEDDAGQPGRDRKEDGDQVPHGGDDQQDNNDRDRGGSGHDG